MDINEIVSKFDKFAIDHGFEKSPQESTMALWLFCESLNGGIIEEMEKEFRRAINDKGWPVSVDSCIFDGSGGIKDVLRG